MEEYVVGSTSAAAAAAAAMAGALEGVARVYEHVEPLVRSARAEQVEEELEESVALLDACAAARDALRAMRACALDLEAAVRRGDGAAAQGAGRAYSRLARKARADVRRQQQQQQKRRPRQQHEQRQGAAGSLEEARRVTVAVLERVVTALSRRVAVAAGPSRWSMCIVARAFRKGTRVACENAAAAALAAALPSSSKDSRADGDDKAAAASRAQIELRALGDTIQHLEDGLELLFRRLVQCRVFLLNMCSS